MLFDFTDLDLQIFADFVQQTWSDHLASVHRHNTSPTVGVFQKVVAAFCSDHIKAKFPQDFNELAARQFWVSDAHASIATF